MGASPTFPIKRPDGFAPSGLLLFIAIVEGSLQSIIQALSKNSGLQATQPSTYNFAVPTFAILRRLRASFAFVAFAAGMSAGVCAGDTFPAAFGSPGDVPITAAGFTATGHSVDLSLNFAPTTGVNLTLLNNTGRAFIQGSFSNLTQGQTVDLAYSGVSYRFIANYYGGTGNDLVLQWAATRLVGWGDNFYGEIGNGNTLDQELATPVNLSSALVGKTVIATAAGVAHSLALRSDGRVIAWGSGSYGDLGDGTTTSRLEPVAVDVSGQLSGRTVIAVDAGYSFSVALASDGRVFTWGYNGSGQLGNGTTSGVTNYPLPVAVNSNGILAGRTVVAVAAGYSHVLALCADGTLAAWGDNSAGQLGTGTTTSSNVPVAVNVAGLLAGKSVIAIAAGNYHCLALCSDGTLAAWGANDSGNLGNGTTVTSTLPVAVDRSGVLAGRDIVSIAAGASHSLAVCQDGLLAAWGFNGSGRLGDGTSSNRTVPVAVDSSGVLAGRSVIRASVSTQNSLAYCTDGTVASWGSQSDGRLGFGTDSDIYSPGAVSTAPLAPGERFLMVNTGQSAAHSLAVVAIPPVARISVEQTPGVLLGSGISTFNFGSAATGEQLPVTLTIHNNGITPLTLGEFSLEGRNAADFSTTPPAVPTIAAGASTTFQIQFTAGTGFDRQAMLRIASNDPFVPDFRLNLSATVSGSVATAWSTPSQIPLTTAGLDTTGSSIQFSLGHAPVTGACLTVVNNTGSGPTAGNFDNLAQGQRVDLTHAGVVYRYFANYFGGDGNDLVLQWADTRLVSWGANSDSQLGDGGTAVRSVPTQIAFAPEFSAKSFMQGSTGWRYSHFLASDGTLVGWGSNYDGQVGTTNTASSQPVPGLVDSSGVLSGRRVVSVIAGQSHTLALCADGTLAAWGYNYYGQFGGGLVDYRSWIPLVVPQTGALSGKRVVSLAAGQNHSLAVCSDGTVAAWGSNYRGGLGNDGNLDRAIPVSVSVKGALAGKRVVAVAAGNNHSLALCSDGTVVAWGDNSEGQLGDNSLIDRRVPVAVDRSGVLAGKTVTAIAAGLYHSLALCSDGTVVAWGTNSSGQLGVSGSSDQLVPVAVGVTGALAGRTVVGIAAYRSGSLARCSDGSLVTWGSNSSGELGIGTTSPSSSSVPVLASTSGMPAGGRFAGISNSSQASHLLGIAAVPPDPAMRVEGPDGTVLANGAGSVDFSAGMIVGAALNRTFTLRNLRGGPLTISSVTFEGANPADFILSRPPLGAIEAGSSTTYQIAFSPAAAGMRQAVMRIISNDPLASPFTFQLTGTTATATVLDAVFSSGEGIALSSHGLIASGKTVQLSLNFAPPVGTRLTVVQNTGFDFIQGAFDNLAHCQEIALTYGGETYQFVANYYGGTGNDLVLEPARGRLLAWGSNTSGGLGNGTTTQGLLPAAVDQRGILRDKTLFGLATGGSHSLALCSDGTLAAWGSNSNGQLGNGSTTASLIPVAVDLTGILAGRRVVAVAAGASFSLALCADGAVVGWGLNSSGQLGNGNSTSSNVPVLVSNAGILSGKSVVSITAGSAHCLALCSDGTLTAWGSNFSGVLGDGTSTGSNIPVAVIQTGALAGKRVVALSAGQSHSLALCSDGTAVAWGANTNGQLGRGGNVSSQTPVPVNVAGALAGKVVVALSAGGSHSLAWCRDGTLVAWGSNSHGQLGVSGISTSLMPLEVAPAGALAGKTVAAISAGIRHSSARCSDGSVVSWGDNASGQLGDNSVNPSPVPVTADMRLTVPGGKFIAVGSSQASAHNLVVIAEPPAPRIVVEDGTGVELVSGQALVDFGLTPTGQTTSRSFTIRNTGARDLGGFSITLTGPHASDFSVISPLPATIPPGASSTCVIGYSPNEVGPASVTIRIASNDPLAPAVDLNLSGSGSGELDVVFGSATQDPVGFGKLTATGSTISLSLNYAPAPGEILTVVRITDRDFIGGAFSNLPQGQLVILSYGGSDFRFVANYFGGNGNDLVLHPAASRSRSWGSNLHGQLGIGSTSQKTRPEAVTTTGPLADRAILALAAGERHSLALGADGQAVSWGNNTYGQLGRGNSTSSTVPVEVSTAGVLAGKLITQVAAGTSHSMALCSDGTVATWGLGSSGQLGNGSFSNAPSPVAVSAIGVLSGKTVVAISAGGSHNLALCSDGTLAAWGGNSSGQLGTGTTTSSNVPVAVVRTGVLAGKSVIAVAAGLDHSLALCSDGAVAAWGGNNYGALGDNSMVNRSLPVLVNTSGVLNGRGVAAIAAGSQFSLALCSDGMLASWGDNTSGKLGDGTSSFRQVPVAVVRTGVLAARTVSGIAAAANHSIVTCGDGTLAAWGLNTSGQLGTGTTTSSSVPVLVSSSLMTPGGAFLSAFAGPAATHSLALHVANSPPVFVGLAFSTSWQSSLTLPFPLLLGSASDPDADPLSIQSAGPSSAQGGTLVTNAASITYSPPNGFTGEDSFTLTFVDDRGASTAGTVRIFVGSPPDNGGANSGPTGQQGIILKPGGVVTATWPGTADQLYEIQRSTDLQVWVTIAKAPADSGGRISHSDESAPTPKAFYRIAVP